MPLSAPLPTKLKKEPLVEAIFEIRFSSPVSAASSVLSGLLFHRLSSAGTQMQIERLPMSDIPSQIRNTNPIIKFHPLLRLNTERFMVMLGDLSVTIACQSPYPGWNLLKQKIIEIINILKDSKLIQFIERYSMKYVDIIDGNNITEQIKRLNIAITIGKHTLIAEPFSVRLEITEGELTHIIQLATPSDIMIVASGATRTGILLDIDTVCTHRTDDLYKFTQELPARLESIHMENKVMFFDCLTPETIDYLEPIYDPTSA